MNLPTKGNCLERKIERDRAKTSFRAKRGNTFGTWRGTQENEMQEIWGPSTPWNPNFRSLRNFWMRFGRRMARLRRRRRWNLSLGVWERERGRRGMQIWDLRDPKSGTSAGGPKLLQMFGTSEEVTELPQVVRNFRGNIRNFWSFQENSAAFEIWVDFDTWNSWDRFWIDIDWDSEQRLRIDGLEHSHNKKLAKQSNNQMPIPNYVTKSFQD